MSINNLKDFGKKFKELRVKDLDIGQVELAELMGVSHAALSAIETGKSKSLSIDNLIKFLEVYKNIESKMINLNWLIMDIGGKFMAPDVKTDTELGELLEKENCYFDKDGFLRKK